MTIRPNAVVVDIDGTICTRCDRDPFDLTRVGGDLPIIDTLRVVQGMEHQYAIVYLTARGEESREETSRWLDKHDLSSWFRPLFMRARGDRRDDEVIKREIYEEQIKPHYNVKIALDDNPHVIKMWRDLGVLGWQVADGTF